MVDSDVLLCVAKDNNNLGKAVRKVPKNHGQPPNICICAVHWWWGQQGRSWLIGSILSMEMSAYTMEEELTAHSDKLYKGTPTSPAATTLYDSLNPVSTFKHFTSTCGRNRTNLKLCVYICDSEICKDFPFCKLSWVNIRLVPHEWK